MNRKILVIDESLTLRQFIRRALSEQLDIAQVNSRTAAIHSYALLRGKSQNHMLHRKPAPRIVTCLSGGEDKTPPTENAIANGL